MNISHFLKACTNESILQTIKQDLLDEFPCYFYMKDNHGKYLAGNNRILKDIGFNTLTDLLTATDFDLCQRDTAQTLIANDNIVKSLTHPKIFIEPIEFQNNKKVTSISYKLPLYSKCKRIIGIMGLSFVNDQYDTLMMSPNLVAQSTQSLQYSVVSPLTKRETQILHFVAGGKTARDIAEIFSLSRRTIEHHIENMKQKLGVQTKSQLIQYAQEYIFLCEK